MKKLIILLLLFQSINCFSQDSLKVIDVHNSRMERILEDIRPENQEYIYSRLKPGVYYIRKWLSSGKIIECKLIVKPKRRNKIPRYGDLV